jgi:hypothetical protein
MTINRARLYWGVFFIVLGGVPLAYNQGVVAMDTVEELWRFWPVILIGIGLAIVLARTPGAIIGGLVVAACLGLVFGSLLAVGPEIGCGPNKGPSHSFIRYGTFDASNPSVHLDLQCGTAQVTASSDERWQIDASIRGGDPEVLATSSSLTIRQGDRHGWFFNRSYDLWDVSLPSGMGSLSASVDAGEASFSLAGATIPNATFSLNAGSMTVDLSAASVENLTVDSNVGSTDLILDGASSTSGRISNSVGSTDICAPSSLGLRIRYTSSLASENFSKASLAYVNGAWETLNYDTATYRADLTIDNSVGSVTLNPAGGCK